MLMGGTCLSHQALVRDPEEVTTQVAKQLFCPLHDGFQECMRSKRVEDFLAVKAWNNFRNISIGFGNCVFRIQIKTPMHTTPIGPYVDDVVVPNVPMADLLRAEARFEETKNPKALAFMYNPTC